MLYSHACSYAIRATAQLALVRSDEFVLLDQVCQGTDLPRYFVAKIFQQLVRDGQEQFDQCVVGMARCDDRQPCPQHDQFKLIRRHIKQFLTGTSLQDMSRTLQRKTRLLGRPLPTPVSRSRSRSGRKVQPKAGSRRQR